MFFTPSLCLNFTRFGANPLFMFYLSINILSSINYYILEVVVTLKLPRLASLASLAYNLSRLSESFWWIEFSSDLPATFAIINRTFFISLVAWDQWNANDTKVLMRKLHRIEIWIDFSWVLWRYRAINK